MALGIVLGLIAWAAAGAVGGDIGGYFVGVPMYMGILALITNTPIAKSIARDIEGMVAIIILLVTIPFWVLVFSLQMVALKLGWFSAWRSRPRVGTAQGAIREPAHRLPWVVAARLGEWPPTQLRLAREN